MDKATCAWHEKLTLYNIPSEACHILQLSQNVIWKTFMTHYTRFALSAHSADA